MTDLSTLLFASTDLKTLDGIIVTDLSGLLAPGVRRGEHDTLPGEDGQLGAELPLDAYNFQIGIVVEGDSFADMYTNLAALGAALRGSNGLGQLERRLDNAGATMAGYDAHTANGAFGGINSSLLNLRTGQLDLTFANLDGAWWTGTEWVWP